ncbi:MAG: hypothetical protein GY805_13635 [Chloroflexi bacterium]|nr:hypothetical protein [Chloroflexota bacterium]
MRSNAVTSHPHSVPHELPTNGRFHPKPIAPKFLFAESSGASGVDGQLRLLAEVYIFDAILN